MTPSRSLFGYELCADALFADELLADVVFAAVVFAAVVFADVLRADCCRHAPPPSLPSSMANLIACAARLLKSYLPTTSRSADILGYAFRTSLCSKPLSPPLFARYSEVSGHLSHAASDKELPSPSLDGLLFRPLCEDLRNRRELKPSTRFAARNRKEPRQHWTFSSTGAAQCWAASRGLTLNALSHFTDSSFCHGARRSGCAVEKMEIKQTARASIFDRIQTPVCSWPVSYSSADCSSVRFFRVAVVGQRSNK